MEELWAWGYSEGAERGRGADFSNKNLRGSLGYLQSIGDLKAERPSEWCAEDSGAHLPTYSLVLTLQHASDHLESC